MCVFAAWRAVPSEAVLFTCGCVWKLEEREALDLALQQDCSAFLKTEKAQVLLKMKRLNAASTSKGNVRP
jgi:hypothetical protein